MHPESSALIQPMPATCRMLVKIEILAEILDNSIWGRIATNHLDFATNGFTCHV